MKLTIEYVPVSTWGVNVRSLVPQETWDILRRACYKKANYVCEICGGKGDTHPVECHEIWEYNSITLTQKLIGLIALCPSCHRVKHLGRTQKVQPDLFVATLLHLKTVNAWSDEEFLQYLAERAKWYQTNKDKPWKVDISWLDSLAVTK